MLENMAVFYRKLRIICKNCDFACVKEVAIFLEILL
jgi:hypothetical protein